MHQSNVIYEAVRITRYGSDNHKFQVRLFLVFYDRSASKITDSCNILPSSGIGERRRNGRALVHYRKRSGVSLPDQNKESARDRDTNSTYAARESIKLAFDGCNRASPGAGSILKAHRMAAMNMKPCRSAKYRPGQFLHMRDARRGVIQR